MTKAAVRRWVVRHRAMARTTGLVTWRVNAIAHYVHRGTPRAPLFWAMRSPASREMPDARSCQDPSLRRTSTNFSLPWPVGWPVCERDSFTLSRVSIIAILDTRESASAMNIMQCTSGWARPKRTGPRSLDEPSRLHGERRRSWSSSAQPVRTRRAPAGSS